MRPAVITLLLVFCSGIVWAEVYRWVDDDGVTHYSQTPPPKGETTKVRIAPPPSETPEAAEKRLRNEHQEGVEDYLEDRELAKEKRVKEQKELAVRQENCRAARNNLANLIVSTSRLTRLSDGSFVRFTEEEREKRLADTRKAIDEYCE